MIQTLCIVDNLLKVPVEELLSLYLCRNHPISRNEIYSKTLGETLALILLRFKKHI